MGERQHGARIVHRGAAQVLVARHVGVREEHEQVGEQRGQVGADRSHGLDPLGGGLQLERQVEARHRQRSAVAEDDVGGFRVGPDVELRRRGPVAEPTAAHERDAGDATGEIGRRPQGERDVRERSDRYEPDALRVRDTCRR